MDKKLKLIFRSRSTNSIDITLKQGERVLGTRGLTISQAFDNIVITAIDRLLDEAGVTGPHLKKAEILGKIEDKALWAMILKTIKQAIEA